MNLKKFKEEDMINIIYQSQEEKVDKIIKKIDERIRNKLKKIDIERIRGNSNMKNDLKEVFNIMEDNYNIRITEYNKEMYKQGFIDGMILILNCLED